MNIVLHIENWKAINRLVTCEFKKERCKQIKEAIATVRKLPDKIREDLTEIPLGPGDQIRF